jgi:hypothetical protein
MNNIKKLKITFLTECRDDSVGLWELISMTQEILNLVDEQQIEDFILNFVFELLNDNFIMAGFPQRDGTFKAWSSTPKESVQRIKKDWDALDHEPNIGDVIWFYITETGEKELAKLQQEKSGKLYKN